MLLCYLMRLLKVLVFFLFSISFVTGKGSSNRHKALVGIAVSLESDNFEF